MRVWIPHLTIILAAVAALSVNILGLVPTEDLSDFQKWLIILSPLLTLAIGYSLFGICKLFSRWRQRKEDALKEKVLRVIDSHRKPKNEPNFRVNNVLQKALETLESSEIQLRASPVLNSNSTITKAAVARELKPQFTKIANFLTRLENAIDGEDVAGNLDKEYLSFLTNTIQVFAKLRGQIKHEVDSQNSWTSPNGRPQKLEGLIDHIRIAIQDASPLPHNVEARPH